MDMCSNLQVRQCCQPSVNTHNARVYSTLPARNNPLRSNILPRTSLRSTFVNHRQTCSSPPRLVTTHTGLFDQAWGTSIDVETLNQTLPQNLFAASLFPYIGFLYHLTKSKKAPPMTLFGFYFLLVFVFATIPAGIYAKKVYETSLANVDYLHGSAEFLLTLTNLFIVMGLRNAIREAERENNKKAAATEAKSEISSK